MLNKLLFCFVFLTASLSNSSVCLSQNKQTEDTYFKGFYHGVNVFIRNPFNAENQNFCIQDIWVNGKKVTDEPPSISAFEIELGNIENEARVVIRVKHAINCKPELINPEVIQNDLKFRFLKIYVNQASVLWVSSKEDKEGYYKIQRREANEWVTIDTVNTKGGIFLNQHSREVQHAPGDNTYRVMYIFPDGREELSETFNFYSDKSIITYAVDKERQTIEFSEPTKFQLLSENYRILLKGKELTVDISKIPRGKYILKYDGKEHKVQW